jgi:Ion transport protein
VRIVVSGFIFNPPTVEEAYRLKIGPRPTAIVLQQSMRGSRSRSPAAKNVRSDTLKRQYSSARMDRRLSVERARLVPAEPTSEANIRRQYSTLRTPGAQMVLTRGRQATIQPQVPDTIQQPEEDIAQVVPNYPAPIFSAATFQRNDEKDSGKFRNLHKARLARRAYLRHSFNRTDFIAVVSYWIAFVLELSGIMGRHHIYLFRMLACLRIFRLLGITEGTNVHIFRSED